MHRNDDVAAWFRSNWWLLLVFCAGMGFWLGAPLSHQTGADSVARPSDEKAADAEQSLNSLDANANPQGAPGSALEMPGRGAYARGEGEAPISSLYRAPGGAAGEPIVEGGAPASGGEGSFAAALKKVGDSASSSGGWGDQEVRTGFSVPKANFSSMPSRAGGGSSSASMAVSDKPFGLGGNPGLVESRGEGLTHAGIGAQKLGSGPPSLESLKDVEKVSASALLGNSERAASVASRSFDAAGAQSRSVGGTAPAGGGVGLQDGEDVPANLKASDFANLSKKDIKPPEVKESKAAGNDQDQQMMQVAMMGMMMMMGGMMGPEMSQMMPMMMMSMQMLQADKVKS